MTAATRLLSPALTKEFRALLPTYSAALIAIVVGSVGTGYTLIASGLLGFGFGSIALGAQSFGHEYSHRTLGLLLSQPRDRRRIFFEKLSVLAVMLATLTTVTLLRFDEALKLAASPHTEPAMLVLAAACGLFVAPCLTMLCRSTLAAVVFTIAVPGLLATGADVVGGLIYGLHNAAAIDRFRLVVFWRGMFLICALGAIASWRMFLRLEVIEGQGADVQLPDSLRVSPQPSAGSLARRHHPLRALVTKEIRLQQMALVVAAIYMLLWVALVSLERAVADAPKLSSGALTVFYSVILAMLIGSAASAEERRLGTLEWQTLLPIPAWHQWAVKVGITSGLVLLLGVGLPTALEFLNPAGVGFTRGIALRLALGTGVLAIGSLYVSSVCGSGVAALVLSIPTFVTAAFFVQAVHARLWRLMWLSASNRSWLDANWTFLLVIAVVAGFLALLLWLAFLNHRTADRSTGRSVTQVLAITSYVTVGLTALVLLGVRW